MAYQIDQDEIRRAVCLLHPDGDPFEVRFIAGRWNMAGMFSDPDTLIQALGRVNPRVDSNVYITLNRVNDACYSRRHRDMFVEYQSPTVSDTDITGYQWLLIDVDPERPSGTSSTDADVKTSREVAKRILLWLRERGWPDPITAHSGNGTHLLYSIELSNTDERKKLIESSLKALGMLFSDNRMKIDLTTFNPSRVCKLYGTVARKGANTQERPHRMSHVLYVPERIEKVKSDFLVALSRLLPQEEKPAAYNGYNPNGFDLEAWLAKYNIPVKERTSWSGGKKWILECCPFNPSHDKKDAAIIQGANGALGFHCFHNSCASYGWKEFRQLYEPDAYNKPVGQAQPNYLQGPIKGFAVNQAAEMDNPLDEPREEPPADPPWRTTEQIRQRMVPDDEHILTGITGIDSRMMGLKKTFLTILSGLRSAGKSSILSQLVVQCRQQGLRCAMFSGEMTDKQVLKWLTLQAAGKNHVHGTKYERVFYPDDDAEVDISKWLDQYVWVYNNDYGNNYTQLRTQIIKVTTEKQLDMVLLDNLMAMNIEQLDRERYDQQSKLVKDLKALAKQLNVHIILVAHPRKSQGFLRLDDISGSGDITNAADNVFIIHRVNEDFKRLTQQTLGWKNTNAIYTADNVIEICKDRDLGNQDVFIPLYFERETKRLKNEVAEYVHYGWEQDAIPEGFTPIDDADKELPF